MARRKAAGQAGSARRAGSSSRPVRHRWKARRSAWSSVRAAGWSTMRAHRACRYRLSGWSGPPRLRRRQGRLEPDGWLAGRPGGSYLAVPANLDGDRARAAVVRPGDDLSAPPREPINGDVEPAATGEAPGSTSRTYTERTPTLDANQAAMMAAGGSGPCRVGQQVNVSRLDPQGVQRQRAGGVDDLDRFGAVMFGEARGNGREVPQREPGEVRGVRAGDVTTVQVDAAGVDAALFEVGRVRSAAAGPR